MIRKLLLQQWMGVDTGRVSSGVVQKTKSVRALALPLITFPHPEVQHAGNHDSVKDGERAGRDAQSLPLVVPAGHNIIFPIDALFSRARHTPISHFVP